MQNVVILLPVQYKYASKDGKKNLKKNKLRVGELQVLIINIYIKSMDRLRKYKSTYINNSRCACLLYAWQFQVLEMQYQKRMYTLLECNLFEGTDKVSSLREHNVLEKELIIEGKTHYTYILMIFFKSSHLIRYFFN